MVELHGTLIRALSLPRIREKPMHLDAGVVRKGGRGTTVAPQGRLTAGTRRLEYKGIIE